MLHCKLQGRTGFDQGLAGAVALILVEVLDEAGGQILGFLFPLSGVLIGVAGIQDTGIHAGELGGNLEVEIRDLLGGGFVDAAVQDGVDDAARVLDGDALARAVPAGVHEVGLGAALLHLLDEFLGVLGRMELQESLAEAGGEGGGGLGDAALGACELGGEAGEEVVLSLLGSKDGYRGQHSESVGGEENDLLRCGSVALGTDYTYAYLSF